MKASGFRVESLDRPLQKLQIAYDSFIWKNIQPKYDVCSEACRNVTSAQEGARHLQIDNHHRDHHYPNMWQLYQY